ncbi:aldehyde dehydrogenase family protein [Halomonas urumqiensis]|uniref:Aldehyde dehydrogenase n=1 Tax=Halomonas urumqiensis TaxID=1684789 RepID=A0A2N7UCN8_9GAMM|nr:aldehyde dehydrogenase family protein [Halomonas urumqiensis]PMR78190.1 aldehyde dehydrogenase [Halomonas urumqiensis]PTB03339.1 aldehyde dehydrogenase [Halomonas urumqiensis]GHE20496.1 aldehyde dehydrogenase [Halomonas urumqiensis]
MSTLERYYNYIDGAWTGADNWRVVLDPATDEPYAEIADAGIDDADAAMAAARRCVDSGALSTVRPAQRVTWLLAIAEEIRALTEDAALVLCRENGKSLDVARGEFEEAARYFEYYAGMADKIEGTSIPLGDDYVDFTSHEPMGVSVQIVPWNFPPSICARSLAPALAAGNAVVIKSPEISPLAMTFLMTACERAGLPKGAVNLLCGKGSVVGSHLVSHRDANQIVFTGSVPTGQRILREAAERATPSVMELGGKSAAIVHADADIEQVIDSVKAGIFFNAGQVCSAMSRLLVHRSRYDEVVERTRALAEGMSIGPGVDNPDLTPLVSRDQLERVEAMCRRAIEAGATCVTGGERVSGSRGYFMQPTVFTHVATDSEIFQEEVFGPVLVIHPFDSEDEAIALANGTAFGLVAGVFDSQLDRALRTARRLRGGQVFINEWFAGGVETPFGGVGLSGFGREKGQEALYSYVQTRNIAVRIKGA